MKIRQNGAAVQLEDKKMTTLIPVKIKWLAWLDIAVFVIGIVQSLLAGSWLGAILPVVALLNFLVFIWPAIDAFIRQQKYRHNPQTVNFKKAVRQQQQQRGYHGDQ